MSGRERDARSDSHSATMSIITTSTAADEHGNPISAGEDAVTLYDQALDRFLRFSPEVVTLATTLAEQHSDVAMSHALIAYLHLSSTQRADAEVALAAWQGMAATPMGEREQAHHDAIGAWARGRWDQAAQIVDDLLVRWPTDLLALMVGHQLDFFQGDAASLRDRPARSLPAIDPAHPHAALVRGMLAFGLEESGHYEAAEQAGLAALAVNADDVWSIHAVTHTYEMRGLVDTGIEFLTAREADWGSGNLFTVHNWWHLALFYLEIGEHDTSLAIYDREVHNAESDGVALEMLDAAALLWRLHLDGLDTGGRFAPLADAWAAATSTPWYAFNDLHAVLAFVGADRMADAERVVERLTRYVDDGSVGSVGPVGSAGSTGAGTNLAMTAEIGLPSTRAIVAHGQQRWDDVVAELLPIRRRLQRFGGSHAQRDVLQRTLLDAALRSGRTDLARGLISERLAVRPTSAYAAAQQSRLDGLLA